jgi:hypothetical protein
VATDNEDPVELQADYILKKPPTRIELMQCVYALKQVKQRNVQPKSEPKIRKAIRMEDDDPKITVLTAIEGELDALFSVPIKVNATIHDAALQLGKEHRGIKSLVRAGEEIEFDRLTVLQHEDFIVFAR